MDEQWERLIQDDLDGCASPEEATRLRERLERDETLRARRRDVEAALGALGSLPLEDPPAELRAHVLRSLPGAHRTGTPRTALFWSRPAQRTGFAFAAGVAIGVLAAALVAERAPSPPTHAGPIEGTMAPPLESAPPAAAGRLELPLAGGAVRLRADRGESDVHVSLDPTAPGDLEVVLDFDPQALAPAGLRGSSAAPTSIESRPGRVMWRGDGRAGWTLDLHAAGAAGTLVRVSVRRGGADARGSLAVAPASRR